MQKNIVLIYNPHSGSFVSQNEETALESFRRILAGYPGMTVHMVPFDGGSVATCKQCIEQYDASAVWVAGGDGTVLSIAALAGELGIPLGVLPAGTMNLLARDLGMSLDMETAIKQLQHAEAVDIDVARINDSRFLCISNIGMSTRLTARREKLRHWPGWRRWPLIGWYLVKLFFEYPAMTVELEVDGTVHRLRTRSISVSNNPLDRRSMLIPQRSRIDMGRLGVYAIRDRSLWSLPRLVVRLLGGNWQDDQDLLHFEAQRVTVSARRKKSLRVMSDGELHRIALPLQYTVQAKALTVLKPGSSR